MISDLPDTRFVEQWLALSAGDPIMQFFMARMTKADLVCASPDGTRQETFSLLLPRA
jgi:hypothetical protein